MRHRVFGRKLGRSTNERRALLRNLANALFAKGAITTTSAKAKFIQPYVEKLITNTKKNALPETRSLAAVLTREAFIKLTSEIAPGFRDRTGGYTRIIKLPPRKGDAAPMARLELLGWAKIKPKAQNLAPKAPKSQGKAKVAASKKDEKHQKHRH